MLAKSSSSLVPPINCSDTINTPSLAHCRSTPNVAIYCDDQVNEIYKYLYDTKTDNLLVFFSCSKGRKPDDS